MHNGGCGYDDVDDCNKCMIEWGLRSVSIVLLVLSLITDN